MKTQIFNIQILMKNIIFILLFCTGMVQAQIINIPDANFKAKLLAASANNQIASTDEPYFSPNFGSSNPFQSGGIFIPNVYHSIDLNNDGEIQVSEALLIKYLNVSCDSNCTLSQKISSFEGLQFFTNLVGFECNYNNANTLNLLPFINLKIFRCDSAPNLNNLIFNNNNILRAITLSGLLNVPNFTGGFNNLDYLYISGCQNSSINISDLPLKYLMCISNLSLTSATITNCHSLKEFSVWQNNLTLLNINNLTSLSFFSCESNNLSTLTLNNLPNLEIIWAGYNQLTTLNFNLNSQSNIYLGLKCNNNQFTTIQNLPCNLAGLDCSSNPLNSLFIKNGSENLTLDINNIPNLQYICTNDIMQPTIQNQVNTLGYTNCVVNTYCSFNPNCSYNKINGIIKYDSQSNGCGTEDPTINHLLVKIEDGISLPKYTATNQLYKFYTKTGTFTINPQLENPTYFNASPTNAVQTFTNNNNNVATHNFCITPNGVKNDLEVVLSPIIPARPGFDAHYRLVFKNKGNQPLSGTIVLNFDDSRLDFVSATQTPNNQVTGQLTFNYNNLLPFENRAIDIILNVNSPQETPAVNIGDVLPFTTIINPVTGDEIPTDNTFALNQIVVGAYDPNDITCLQGETVDPVYIGQFLHYQIRFENTGNFPAENVVVAYFVNTNEYDINTLQILNTSHNQLYTRITGNKIEFIFENIQLAPSAGGGGHGTIIIKMKTKNNLIVGDAVAKQANIYFDYNFPIETNEAETTFATLSIGDTLQLNEVSIYPNPAQDILNIKTKTLIKKVELFDIQGRLLQTHFNNSLETTLDIQKYNSGTYFVKVYTENGVGTQKVVKE